MSKLDLREELVLKLFRYKNLRYGENPHQKSAFYLYGASGPGFRQLLGIELSHNNLSDANHAWRLVCDFGEPAVAIIKHGNPSGVATRGNLAEAFTFAYRADPVSAYGGIIACNREPTLAMVERMHGIFFELLIAPAYSKGVLERLVARSSKMRVIAAQKPLGNLELTRVFGGYLVQTPDVISESKSKWKVVVGKKPSAKVYDDLQFAWKVVKHVKSNAIVIARDKILVGMGTGQPNRVNSVKLALLQAKSKARGAVLASDAFFPFADNVELAAKAGVAAIIQPGGSINDEKVIAEAKKHGMTMIFTGVRHFKH